MIQESGPGESSSLVATHAAVPPSELSTELLSDGELDAIEDELARAEKTLSLLADDDIDPAAATAWLGES